MSSLKLNNKHKNKNIILNKKTLKKTKKTKLKQTSLNP
jgi:hypothetical protein